MKYNSKRIISGLLSFFMLFSLLPYNIISVYGQSSQVSNLSEITVSDRTGFMNAIKDGNKRIIVNGTITLGEQSDSSGRMLPVIFKENTEIVGSSGASLVFRGPMQLEGDNVSFKNINMHFESTNALNSVPHREIFLAGHSLKLDNVDTYLPGSGGSLGGLGGTEKELLPTVYGGAYPNTQDDKIGNNASLTVENANSNTIFQGIYLGHDTGNGMYKEYNGASILNMGERARVRDGINSKNSTSSTIHMKGVSLSATAGVTKFIGNDTTKLKIDNIQVTNAEIQDIGFIEIVNEGKIVPVSNKFNNVIVKDNSILDLSNAGNVVINGNFTGGGKLTLSKDYSVEIKGNVTGETTISTWGGILNSGKTYISSSTKTNNNAFNLDSNLSNYELKQEGNNWVVYSKYVDAPVLGSVEVVSKASTIDLNKINDSDYKGKQLQLICRDEDGNIISGKVADDNYLLYETFGIKTEYWNETTHDSKNNGVKLITLSYDEQEDIYNLNVPSDQDEGNYAMLILSEAVNIDASATVADVKNLVRDKVISEIPFRFYRSNNSSSATTINPNDVQAIPDQVYTGREVTPDVTVTVNGKPLTNKTDYELNYKNNKNVGIATVEIIGINSYKGTVEKTFNIVKGDANLILKADKTTATYGDTIKFTFEATGKQRALTANANEVSFYCGNELLGTATVDSNGRASLNYLTSERKIPIGKSTISVVFGGNNNFNPSTSPKALLDVTLEKQRINLKNQNITVSLSNLKYDGKTRTTNVQSVTLENGTTFPVIGRARLPKVDVGEYDMATLASLKPNGSEGDWYEFTGVEGTNVKVSPKVNILKGDAPAPVVIQKVVSLSKTGDIDISKFIPSNVVNPKYTLVNTPGTYVDVKLENNNIKYTPKNIGEQTVTVKVSSNNYEDMTINIHFIVTDKELVSIGLQAPNQIYNGKAYSGWTITQPIDKCKVSYYDLTQQKDLKEAPKEVGSYSITVSLETDSQLGVETKNFTIEPKEVRVKAIDREININDTVPNLDNPKLGIDYKFDIGYEPLSGESIGEIHMKYDKVPDNTNIGDYNILLEVNSNNKNYNPVGSQGKLKIVNNNSNNNSNNNDNNNNNNNNSGGGGGASIGFGTGSNLNNNDNTKQEIPPIKPNSNSIASVTEQDIKEAIDGAKKNNQQNMTVVIPIETANNNMITVTLPKEAINLLVKDNVKLEISAKNSVNLEFDVQTLSYIGENGAGELVVDAQKQTQISEEAQKVVGARPAYDITLSWLKDGNKHNIEKLKGNKIKVSLPYTPSSQEVKENLHAVYINDRGEVQWLEDSSYNPKKGVVEFTTDHFSIYAVGYQQDIPVFNDIIGHWAEKDIMYVTQLGLFKGINENTFDPKGNMTRGMFVTVLGRLAGIDNTSLDKTHFIDIPSDSYYASHVKWASDSGIVKGTSENTFEPNRMITRQEMAVMMKNFSDKLGYSLPISQQSVLFSDSEQISSWAIDSINTMQQAGIIYGKENNYFEPLGTATRAEVASVLNRFIKTSSK